MIRFWENHCLLAGSLCLMVALESTSIKFVKTRQKQDIPSEQLVLLVEIFKLVASLLFYILSKKESNGERRPLVADRTRNSDSESDQLERENTSSILWYMFPAALYAVSNNVTFAALSILTPAMFNLLMNLKIPTTALMAWLFVHHRINRLSGLSFILLFLGSALATLKMEDDGSIVLGATAYGIVLMVIYSSCSAGGAVYTEYVIKLRYASENIHLQNIKFCFCSIIANAGIMLYRWKVPFATFEPLHLLGVVALASNGLVTAAVLKYGGSILKTYAASLAMFFSALFGYLIWHTKQSWQFYVGGLICGIAVQLYAKYR